MLKHEKEKQEEERERDSSTNHIRGLGCASAWQSITMFWPATHSISLGFLIHFGGTVERGFNVVCSVH